MGRIEVRENVQARFNKILRHIGDGMYEHALSQFKMLVPDLRNNDQVPEYIVTMSFLVCWDAICRRIHTDAKSAMLTSKTLQIGKFESDTQQHKSEKLYILEVSLRLGRKDKVALLLLAETKRFEQQMQKLRGGADVYAETLIDDICETFRACRFAVVRKRS